MNRFFLLLVLLIGCVTPIKKPNTEYQPVIIDDVYWIPNLPQWGEICIATDVYGNPYGLDKPKYSLEIGEVVRLHELSRPDGTWVSIGAAQWMPLKNLC